MDGAEFYRDTEFNVWSMSSILAAGDAPGLKLEQRFMCIFNQIVAQ